MSTAHEGKSKLYGIYALADPYNYFIEETSSDLKGIEEEEDFT